MYNIGDIVQTDAIPPVGNTHTVTIKQEVYSNFSEKCYLVDCKGKEYIIPVSYLFIDVEFKEVSDDGENFSIVKYVEQ